MKLKSLHITNYGKLSNYDYTFSNISSFCEDNGYGKTTITSFIIAMFYGLEGYTTKTKEFVDRKHFFPFKGGTFGGNIVFDYNDKEYRIERTFTEKSTTGDTLNVYCKNKSTEELGEVPGETIFGINKASFERLLLVNADKIQIESSTDINKKLNNYVENVGEEFNIDKVLEKIKESKKECTKSKTTLDGIIKEDKNKIKNFENTRNALEGKYEKLNVAEEEMKEADRNYSYAANQGTVVANWKNYDGMISEANNKKNNIDEIVSRYPKGIPSEEEYKELVNANTQLSVIKGSMSSQGISDEQKSKYELLKAKFSKHLPSEEELNEIDEKISKYDDFSNKIEALKNDKKTDREIELEKHFYGEKINEDTVKNLELEVSKYDDLENELKRINPAIVEKQQRTITEKKNVNKGLFMGLMVLSIILLGAGVGLMFVMLPVGVVLLILGIALLIGDMFYYFNTKLKSITNTSEETVEKTNPEYENKFREIESKKNDILRMLANYRYNDSNPIASFVQFKNDAREYNSILESKNADKSSLQELDENKKALEEELNKYFLSYNMSLNLTYKYLLGFLRKEVIDFNMLTGIINSNDKSKKELESEKITNEKVIVDFYSKYSIERDNTIESIRKDIDDYNRLNREYKEKMDDADKFKTDNKLDIRPEIIEFNLEELEAIKRNKLTEFNRLKEEIEKDEEEVQQIDDLNNNVINNTRERDEKANKAKLFEALSNEISKADEILKEKYVAPIKNRFCYYADLLEKAIGEKVKMDSNYRVSFDRDGALRSFEHLSSGYLAICALCFRLALIDNLFEGELPFIILDDPFVNLDSKKLDKAISLIKELSKDKQIIYFCCHESRLLK